MRLSTALLPLTLAVLAACGGSTDAESDPFKLMQAGNYEAAITAAESQLATVEKGTPEHKDLVVKNASALSNDSAEKAKAAFLGFAAEFGNAVEPTDIKFVVAQLRKHKKLSDAIDVMDAGKKRWPGDKTMDDVVDALKQDIATSGDDAAAQKMKGLGYV